MKVIKLLALGSAAIILSPLLFWVMLSVGVAEKPRYMALARSGLLVLGIAGMAWGLFWKKARIVLVALLLLGIGMWSFRW